MRMSGMPTDTLNGFAATAGSGSRSSSKMIEHAHAFAEYERLLRELHPNFSRRLLRRAPAITPMELKVCILARTFLGIKESASILSVSESSIESHRWHARCKLGIKDRGLNLTSVLHAL
jgi:hypothetical protein